MKRIIMHWTGGADGVTPHEADSYNYVISREAVIYPGVPEDRNIPPLVNGAYAAHTRNANSWAIGIALDAMANANEIPFRAGRYPITKEQYGCMVEFVAAKCFEHGIKVTRENVLTHAEVERTLGISQRNKWDIMWLPGLANPQDPIWVGDAIRNDVRKALTKLERPIRINHWRSGLIAGILSLFSKKKG